LNRYAAVKAFLNNDITPGKYGDKITVSYIGGNPRVQFFDADNVQLGDEVSLAEFQTADDIREFFTKHGIVHVPREEEPANKNEL